MHGVVELKKAFKLNRKDTEHVCHVCDFKTTVKASLKRHIGSEHGENELRNYRIKDQREWKKQFEERNPKKESSNVCPHCGEVSIFYLVTAQLQHCSKSEHFYRDCLWTLLQIHIFGK